VRLERPVRVGVRLLLLVLAGMAWKGYRFGSGNQSLQVPLLKHVMDPSLYAHDLVLRSFEWYTSFFFSGLAFVLRTPGVIERAYFFLFVLTEWAALGAVFALATLAFADLRAAFFACLLYLPGIACPGSESTNQTLFTHSGAVGALLLWDIYLWARGRRVLALGVCGLLFNLHALYALHVGVLLLVDGLLAGSESRRSLVPGLFVFALLASPTLLWLGGGEPVTPALRSRWFAILRERSAAHAFPLSIGRDAYGAFLLFFALGLLGYRGTAPEPFHGTARRLALGVLVLVGIALLFSEWWPLVGVVRAQPIRSTKWLGDLVLVFGGALCARAGGWGVWGRGGLLLDLLGWFGGAHLLLALGIATLLLVGRPRDPAWILLVLAMILLGKAGLSPGLGVIRELARALLRPPVAAAVLVGAVLVWTWTRRSVAVFVLEGVIGLGLLGLLPAIQAREEAAAHDQPWTTVQEWVRLHTDVDSILLTPPEIQGFRVFSERGIVGEWKDGTQQFFSPSYAIEWWQRMQALGGGAGGYGSLGTDDLVRLARTYGARWIVCRREQRVSLRPAYADQAFAVYPLPDGS
jgi:hypothetical protein